MSLWLTVCGSRTVSRVLSQRLPVCDRHSSRSAVARTLKQPTRKAVAGPAAFPIWSCSERGMPSMPRHRGIWWSLTPPFHPYPTRGRAVCFLWRCPRVAPPGCYPASCPVEPGLSSPGFHPRRRSVRLPQSGAAWAAKYAARPDRMILEQITFANIHSQSLRHAHFGV